MDGGHQKEALVLFDKALSMDPDAVDALLHRANLRMLQTNLDAAEADLRRYGRPKTQLRFPSSFENSAIVKTTFAQSLGR